MGQTSSQCTNVFTNMHTEDDLILRRYYLVIKISHLSKWQTSIASDFLPVKNNNLPKTSINFNAKKTWIENKNFIYTYGNLLHALIHSVKAVPLHRYGVSCTVPNFPFRRLQKAFNSSCILSARSMLPYIKFILTLGNKHR